MTTNKDIRFVLNAEDKTSAAFNQAKRSLDAVKASATSVVGSFGTLGVAIGAAFTGASLVGAVETLDSLSKLSQKSGIAVESLSALRFAGEQAGVGIDDLGKGFKELSTRMAAAASGDKGARALFDAIGVSVKGSNGQLRSTGDVLKDIADRFITYADGAGKSALATDLFGKAGQALIPLLNQGSAGLREQEQLARDLGAVYGGDLAKKGEEFNDNLKKLALVAEGAKVQLLEKLLPALNATAEAFINNAKNSNIFLAVVKTLGQGAAQRLGVDDVSVLEREAKGRSRQIDALINDLQRLDKASQAYADTRAKIADLQSKQLKTTDLLKGKAAVLEPPDFLAALRNHSGSKPDAPHVITEDTGAAEEFATLLDRINRRIAATREELALGRQLTESEKFQLDVEEQLSGAKTKLIQDDKNFLRITLGQSAAFDEANRLLNERLKADGEILDMTLKQIQGLEQTTAARTRENQSLRENLEEIGLTSRAVEDLRQKRLQQALAVEESKLGNAEASAAEIAATERSVEALRKKLELQQQLTGARRAQEDDPFKGATAALQQFGEDAQKQGLQVKAAVEGILGSLEEEGVKALRGSGFDAKRIVDQMINEFLRLNVIKPLLNSIFSLGGNTGSSASLFASIFSLGARADGGPVSAGVPYMVGERGPELFVPHHSGAIVPHGAAGSVTLGGPTIYIDSRSDAGQVAQLVRQGVKAGQEDTMRQFKAMGLL